MAIPARAHEPADRGKSADSRSPRPRQRAHRRRPAESFYLELTLSDGSQGGWHGLGVLLLMPLAVPCGRWLSKVVKAAVVEEGKRRGLPSAAHVSHHCSDNVVRCALPVTQTTAANGRAHHIPAPRTSLLPLAPAVPTASPLPHKGTVGPAPVRRSGHLPSVLFAADGGTTLPVPAEAGVIAPLRPSGCCGLPSRTPRSRPHVLRRH